MRGKKLLKGFGWTAAIVFVFMNALAALHAYKFTHFTTATGVKKHESAAELSNWEKAKIAISGIDYPMPVNRVKPNIPYETLVLQSNKKIECWLLRTAGAKGTIILFHGYTADKSKMLDKAYAMQAMGYNTMLVDFMGSGGSEGEQCTIGYKEAEEVKTCYDYLRGAGEQHVYLFGSSMGAVAIMKAINDYQLSPEGVVLECPFATMYKTVCARFRMVGAPAFPMAALMVFWGGAENGFWAFSHNPVDYAKRIKCPTLLLYGERDDRVSRGEIDAIYKNIAGRKSLRTFAQAGHDNYLMKAGDEWRDAVKNFLAGR